MVRAAAMLLLLCAISMCIMGYFMYNATFYARAMREQMVSANEALDLSERRCRELGRAVKDTTHDYMTMLRLMCTARVRRHSM